MLARGLLFTDIHWGKKQNSDTHNTHCSQFIDFVCDRVKSKKDIDHIIFLGDWFEHRNAINISTLNFAYHSAKKLNDLQIPIYFIIGNHDMYTRVDRQVYATIEYREFENFRVISEPTKVSEIGNGVLLCPYLFHHEYEQLYKFDVEYAYGHFEFNGFVLTGASNTFTGGPEHTDFQQFKRIFSGHFHKRQKSGNVIYIGNTFPMDYSDANDNDRGYVIHDHKTDTVEYVNWPDCPKYVKTTLSDIINNTVIIPDGANVQCVADVNMEYSKLIAVKNSIIELYQLNSIDITEPNVSFSVDENEIEEIDSSSTNIDDAIVKMLHSIECSDIDNNTLVSIYQKLK